MEDERGFIQEANTPGILQTRIQYATLQLPTTWQELLKESFHDVQWGTTCRTAEAVLTSILKLVMWWSDWCHLDCVKHSYPSTPDLTYSHFLEAIGIIQAITSRWSNVCPMVRMHPGHQVGALPSGGCCVCRTTPDYARILSSTPLREKLKTVWLCYPSHELLQAAL